ncbi:MAG: HAMP domain-containing sensor histidine kinase [Bacteroidota bacterium]
MKYIVGGLLLISLGSSVQGQDKIDSLQNVLSVTQGLDKARAQVALADVVASRDEELAYKYLDSAAEVFLDLGQQQEWVIARAEKVILLESYVHNFRALNTFQQIDSLLYLIDTTAVYPNLLAAVGKTTAYLGNSYEGAKYLQEALDFFAKENDTMGQIDILAAFGFPQFESLDAQYTLDMQDSAIRLAESHSATSAYMKAVLYNNLGSSLLDLGLLEAAEEQLIKGLEYSLAARNPEMDVYIYFTLAEVQVARQAPREARRYFGMAAALRNSMQYVGYLAVALEAESHYELLRGNRARADELFQETVSLLDSLGWLSTKADTYDSRYRVLKLRGDYQSALAALEEWARLKFSELNEQQQNQIEEIRTAVDIERSARKYETLKRENEFIRSGQRRNSLLYLSVIGGILGIGVILAFFLARTRRLNESVSRQNATLAEQNQRLQQLTEDNELLMGIVAHDLKAPLVKIESLIGLIVPEAELPPEKKPLMQMARRVIQGGQTLVSDILLLSEAGRGARPDLDEHALGELVDSVVQDFREIAARKRIELIVDTPDEPVEVLVHPPYLIRILDNLLSNAIKFSQTGSAVRLRWGHDGPTTWLEVSDNGPGIPEAERERIFERFAKLSNRPTAGESSTGLGMFIVKTLLDTMGGTIEMETEVGVGTTFRVRLAGGG